MPSTNPTRIRFEIENLPLSSFPKLSVAEQALPARERTRLELSKYAERVISERGWCPNGIYPLTGSSVDVGGGRRVDKFTIECK